MDNKRQILVVDSIPFNGGSKVATQNILNEVSTKNATIRVLTADQDAWNSPHLIKEKLHEFTFLTHQESGYFYFLRHLFLLFNVLWLRLKHGPFDLIMGPSWPGNDLSIYLAKWVLGTPVLQIIHGPVAASRTVAKCLQNADYTFYLSSAEDSINDCLAGQGMSITTLQQSGHHFEVFTNGLPSSDWPSTASAVKTVKLFWAASLLKWKGLDILLNVLSNFSDLQRPSTDICYIRPKKIQLEVTHAPVNISAVTWHEAPDNLDQIRSQTNVFISTSHKEPFGLSILEAMAAGHCIIIPRDNAYWDQKLTENQDCLKYRPNSHNDLAEKISYLMAHPNQIKRLSESSKKVAQQYRAERVYRPIVEIITGKQDD